MSLGLLAPAALALGVLVAGPVLAHLARREPQDTRAYGAIMLLRRLQARLARRRRLHDRALLFLRMLAIALLVLVAAQPELRRVEAPSEVGGTGRVIVVLDTSLSMDQRAGGDPIFALARRDAAAQLRALPAGTQVVAITAGAPARALGAFTDDAALVASLVEAEELQPIGTDLRGALTLARGLLDGNAGEILVYTDEAGPGTVETCAEDLERLLARGSAVVPRVYGDKTPANVAPIEAEYGDGLEGGSVRVRLANWGREARELPTTVTLPDGASMTAFVEVPAGTDVGPGVAEERFTVPRQAEGGVARVAVDDPSLPADNARYFHLPRVGASRVLVVDGDPGSSPTRSEVYFLERALAPFGAGGPAVDVVAPSGMRDLDPERHRVVFLANVADPVSQAPALVDFVRRGGGLVIGMGDNVTAERYNTPLASILPAPLRRPRDLVDLDAARGVPLAPPDPEVQEIFRPFARAGRESFARVGGRRVMTTDAPPSTEDVDVLLRYADGLPALLERRVGSGRVLLWTGTFDLGWGDLPLHAVFMPLVQRIVGYLGGETGPLGDTAAGTVGEPVALRLPPTTTDAEVVGPDGGLVASERASAERELRFSPRAAGAYAAKTPEGAALAWVAVNTPASESDVRRTASLVETQARIAPDRMTRRWPLSLPTLAVAFGALAGAGILSARGRNDDAAA